jgi:hypothetical protein
VVEWKQAESDRNRQTVTIDNRQHRFEGGSSANLSGDLERPWDGGFRVEGSPKLTN